MVIFKKHILIRRSFEIISLYLAPYHSLNLFFGPFITDSKSDPAEDNNSIGDAARRIVLPTHSRNIPLCKPPDEATDSIKESTDHNSTSLGDFVRRHCRSLFHPWSPTWWLRSGHLQTFWSSAGDFSEVDPVRYQRTLLELPDGGLIAVDFTEPEDENISPNTPIVLVLPGLTGGSQASYVRSLLSIASAPRSKGGLGYRGVVVNSRGCGDVPLRTPQISAGSADDLRSALLYIQKLYPDAPCYAVGFSLGATVLTKYLGEEREHSQIQAGCVVACPWDLLKNSEILESRFFYRHVYSRALAKSYLALLHRSLPTLTIPSESVFNSHLEIIRTLRSPTFTQVNTHLTSIIGGAPPIFPHSSVEAFYTWASCASDLQHVRVPLLCVNADDDPIVSELPFDEVQLNEGGWVGMVVTRGGGHLGWFEKEGKRRWIRTPILEWIRAISEEVDWEKMRDVAVSATSQASTAIDGSESGSEQSGGSTFSRERITDYVEDEDGFIRGRYAEGRYAHIGYRVLSSGGEQMGDTAIPGALAGL